MLHKRYIILTLAATLMASCGKKFLDKKPLAVISEEKFYKTEKDFTEAVNAAYDPLNWQIDQTQGLYANDYFYGDVASDDSRKGGENESDLGEVNGFDRFYLVPTNTQVRLTWRYAYRGIYLSNLVINKIGNLNSGQKDNIHGQALFLRAFYHFKLVRVFGDVPLVTKPLEQGEFEVGKTPKAQVYAQIEKDLTDAIAKLPARGATQEGRATKGAARALLMRVYLFQNKWEDLKTQFVAFEAEKGTAYALEAKYADVFAYDNQNANNSEAIFAIQAGGGTNGDPDNPGRRFEGMVQSVMTAPRYGYGGWGFNRPTQNLYDEFLTEKTVAGTNDPRLKATIVSNGDTIPPATIMKIPVTDSTAYPYSRHFNRKYVLDQTTFDAKTSLWQIPMNFIVLRYADVLLMAAEAYNETGDPTNALKYLKQVRDRVGMPEIKDTDKETLKQKIWKERRLELALEGLRFFDLVRQGRAAEVMKNTGDDRFEEGRNFVKGKHEVFPIPQEQIDLSNGKLIQNNGY